MMHWIGGKEESKLTQVSGWDGLLLGITLCGKLFGNRFVCGGGSGTEKV